MAVEVSALERLMPDAVRHFWQARILAARSQKRRGVSDQGRRGGVTAGKNTPQIRMSRRFFCT